MTRTTEPCHGFCLTCRGEGVVVVSLCIYSERVCDVCDGGGLGSSWLHSHSQRETTLTGWFFLACAPPTVMANLPITASQRDALHFRPIDTALYCT